MPKAFKAKSTARTNPLQKTDGNVTKKKPTRKSSRRTAAIPEVPSPIEESTSTTESAITASSPGENDAGTVATPPGGVGSANAIERDTPTKRPQGRENLGPNYLLYCSMSGTSDPTITRFLCVPAELTFRQMHQVMQVVFGWAGCHVYQFKVEEQLPDEDEERGMAWPKTLLSLMDYVTQDEDVQQASEWILADVFDNERYAEKVRLVYEYDMGDSWEHDILLIGREAPGMRLAMGIAQDAHVVCLSGEGHPCAEDSGGYSGWEDLKDAFSKARSRNAEETDMRDWYKSQCANGDPKGLNPYKWSVLDVNDGLDELTRTHAHDST